MPVVDEPHGPACDPRQLRRGKCLEARDLLAAEPAADELCPNSDVVLPQPERAASSSRAEKIPCVEIQAVSWSPSQEATAPCGSSGVCSWADVRCSSSTDLGGGEGCLGVTTRIVARFVDEALLVHG